MATKARHLKTPLQLWIADNRKRLGLEPTDLAQLTGVTEATVRGWESRGRPSEDALVILERRFGLAAPRGQDVAGGMDTTAIVEAINGLTAAVDRIESRLEANSGVSEGLADSLMALLRTLASEHVDNGAGSARQRAGSR